jgi:uncharacterized membrane protein YhaH (DUF805 family)/predicted RNA-binding Zn-ribbon protein involved in translation (DUF1610 family)
MKKAISEDVKKEAPSDNQQKADDEMFCSSCGAIIKKEAEICPQCGVRYKAALSHRKTPWNYFTDTMKKYIVFSGRSRRAEFWYFFLWSYGINVLVYIVSINALGDQWPQYVVTFGFFLPGLAVGWRRMHDIGKTGSYFLIPIYNLVLAATQGVSGPNEYGQDPRADVLSPDGELSKTTNDSYPKNTINALDKNPTLKKHIPHLKLIGACFIAVILILVVVFSIGYTSTSKLEKQVWATVEQQQNMQLTDLKLVKIGKGYYTGIITAKTIFGGTVNLDITVVSDGRNLKYEINRNQ